MSQDVLNRHWEDLKKRQNVLNVGVSTKWKNGKDTGIPSITIYVSKKMPAAELAAEHVLPSEIEGVPTDVIEFAPTSWKAGPTSVSDLHPELQKRKFGLSEQPSPKAIRLTHAGLTAPSGASDLTPMATPIRDQENCGICTSEGPIGVWETAIRLSQVIGASPVLLSVAHLFFCSGGTCDGGNTVEAVLDQATKGVCLETCLPYQDSDQPCGQGICKNWWLNAKKLASWLSITDPTEIRSLLDKMPLVATMAVHQSWMNYISGIYKNLGPSDPVVGYHCIGILGYSDAKVYRILRNSWGVGWAAGCVINGIARPGYCLIDPGELDPGMYELILSNDPVPAPNPVPAPPKPKCWLLRLFGK